MNPAPVVTHFGEYRVIKKLGSGSYAHTYLAEDPKGAPVAVKWLRPDSEPHGAERFQNEAWALGKLKHLNHPSIPQLIGTGDLEDRPYIVMSFAPGEDLRVVCERQRSQHETMGQLKMLRIAEAVLDTLAQIHNEGICHRDVKDANILVGSDTNGELRISLVDFGMCKGGARPADAETFFGAGSSKFSPPNKLRYSRQAVANHDVFAVGVLGYLLLTNYFPWEYPTNADHGHFLDRMLAVVPPRIQQLNSKIRREVSELFTTFLDLDDSRRPTALRAVVAVREVIATMEASKDGTDLTQAVGLHFPRVVRDAVHSDIPMSEFEWDLIETPEFQRLRWMRQLGTSHLVYPGAEHTRLSHAVGTMRVAGEIMRRFEERTGQRFYDDERQIARAYALLHDVSHIPYGHALEDEMAIYERHDRNTGRISRLLDSKGSRLGELLRSHFVGRKVLEFFSMDTDKQAHKMPWISQLVEAPCGADVLDYVDRDAYYCGLDHRIDSAIYRRFDIERNYVRALLYGHHGVRLDAEFALESILRERFALFLKVYAHPVKVAAGAMIGRAVSTLIGDKRRPRLDEAAIETMGDHDLLHFLSHSGRPLAKQLADMVIRRELWRPAFRSRVLYGQELDQSHYNDRLATVKEKGWIGVQGREKIELRIAELAGVARDTVIFYCPGKAPGLQRIRQYVALSPETKEVRRDQEPYRRIYSGHLSLWTAYVFMPPNTEADQVARVARAASEILELPNEVDLRPKQLGLFV